MVTISWVQRAMTLAVVLFGLSALTFSANAEGQSELSADYLKLENTIIRQVDWINRLSRYLEYAGESRMRSTRIRLESEMTKLALDLQLLQGQYRSLPAQTKKVDSPIFLSWIHFYQEFIQLAQGYGERVRELEMALPDQTQSFHKGLFDAQLDLRSKVLDLAIAALQTDLAKPLPHHSLLFDFANTIGSFVDYRLPLTLPEAQVMLETLAPKLERLVELISQGLELYDQDFANNTNRVLTNRLLSLLEGQSTSSAVFGTVAWQGLLTSFVALPDDLQHSLSPRLMIGLNMHSDYNLTSWNDVRAQLQISKLKNIIFEEVLKREDFEFVMEATTPAGLEDYLASPYSEDPEVIAKSMKELLKRGLPKLANDNLSPPLLSLFENMKEAIHKGYTQPVLQLFNFFLQRLQGPEMIAPKDSAIVEDMKAWLRMGKRDQSAAEQSSKPRDLKLTQLHHPQVSATRPSKSVPLKTSEALVLNPQSVILGLSHRAQDPMLNPTVQKFHLRALNDFMVYCKSIHPLHSDEGASAALVQLFDSWSMLTPNTNLIFIAEDIATDSLWSPLVRLSAIHYLESVNRTDSFRFQNSKSTLRRALGDIQTLNPNPDDPTADLKTLFGTLELSSSDLNLAARDALGLDQVEESCESALTPKTR